MLLDAPLVGQPLLKNLDAVPEEYVRQVSHLKRVLERWSMDPEWGTAYGADPTAALRSLGVRVTPEEVDCLIDHDTAARFQRAIASGDAASWPLASRRYRGFLLEKFAHRDALRLSVGSSNKAMATWRNRQIQRCMTDLSGTEQNIIHAPAAIELSKGCSVGCWFCGIDAPRLDKSWAYDDASAAFWRESLTVLGDTMGQTCIGNAFLYWASDPLDNPDYEKFLTDFHRVLGKCPQTTTAMSSRNLERTKQILQLSQSLGSIVDRFSIITLKMLRQVHDYFTPEELLRVELVPQNKESRDPMRKSRAGRARRFLDKKELELVKPDQASTIACVSGFLLNMVERSVQLISPCNASDRWPNGYWVLAKEHFESPADLRVKLSSIMDRCMRNTLLAGDRVRLRRDITWELTDEVTLVLNVKHVTVTLSGWPHWGRLMPYLQAGEHSAGEVGLALERDGVPLHHTLEILLNNFFEKSLLDEEPELIPA